MITTKADLAEMPLEERRAAQRASGIVTLSFLRRQTRRGGAPPGTKTRGIEYMHQSQTHTSEPTPNAEKEVSKARKAVEHFLAGIEQGEPTSRTAKKAVIYASIWAPVGLGVGWGLLRMAKKMFAPSGAMTP